MGRRMTKAATATAAGFRYHAPGCGVAYGYRCSCGPNAVKNPRTKGRT